MKVYVVDYEDSAYSRILINAIGNVGYIAPLMELETAEEDDAMQSLKAGECAAVIVLPENAIDGYIYGEETTGRVIVSPAAAAHADVVKTVVQYGELLMATGQCTVYSGSDLLYEAGYSYESRREYLDQVNKQLMGQAISADHKYFQVEVTDYADTEMSTEAYYLLCWMTLLLFLSGNFFTHLCTTDLRRPILCRLRAAGVGDVAFVAGKILYPLVFRVLLAFGILFAAGAVLSLCWGVGQVLLALLGLVCVSVMGTGFVMGLRKGGTVNAALAAVGLFMCGGIIPRQMLPQQLLMLGEITPLGAVSSLFAPVLGGNVSVLGIVCTLGYTALSLLMVFRKLHHVRIGGAEE